MWNLIATIFLNIFPPFYDLNLMWFTSIWPVWEYFCQPPKLSVGENKEGKTKYEIEICSSIRTFQPYGYLVFYKWSNERQLFARGKTRANNSFSLMFYYTR